MLLLSCSHTADFTFLVVSGDFNWFVSPPPVSWRPREKVDGTASCSCRSSLHQAREMALQPCKQLAIRQQQRVLSLSNKRKFLSPADKRPKEMAKRAGRFLAKRDHISHLEVLNESSSNEPQPPPQVQKGVACKWRRQFHRDDDDDADQQASAKLK